MTSNQVELLPCPFCGEPPVSQWWGVGLGEAEDACYWGVYCRNSCAQAHEDSEAEAIAAWNTRLATIRDTDEDAEWLRMLANRLGSWVDADRERLERIASRLASSTPAEPDEPTEAMIEAAYRDGYAAGMVGGGLVNLDDDWTKSDTRKAMSQRKAAPDASGERK